MHLKYLYLVAVLTCSSAAANSLKEALDGAKSAYVEREQNIDNLKEAAETLEEEIEKDSSSSKEKKQALLWFSRISYYLGSILPKKDKKSKLRFHVSGGDAAEAAIEMDYGTRLAPKDNKDKDSLFPWADKQEIADRARELAEKAKTGNIATFTELLYLRMINLASQGKLEAPLIALIRLEHLRGVNLIIESLDVESSNFGAQRVSGMVDFFYENQSAAIAYFQNAFENTQVKNLPEGVRLSSSVSTNYNYAKALGGLADKGKQLPVEPESRALAKKILTDLVNNEEVFLKIYPDSVNETKSAMKNAEKALSRL